MSRLAGLLDEQAMKGQTLTYLEVADHLAIAAPKRIHRTARLVEKLMRRDFDAGRPIRSALVISRVRNGLPAPGFFDRARRLGLLDHDDEWVFHQQLLSQLGQNLVSSCKDRSP